MQGEFKVMNRVCEVLGIEKPVVQAPMPWLTGAELDCGINPASSVVSPVKSIDSCAGIVEELALRYEKQSEERKPQ